MHGYSIIGPITREATRTLNQGNPIFHFYYARHGLSKCRSLPNLDFRRYSRSSLDRTANSASSKVPVALTNKKLRTLKVTMTLVRTYVTSYLQKNEATPSPPPPPNFSLASQDNPPPHNPPPDKRTPVLPPLSRHFTAPNIA